MIARAYALCAVLGCLAAAGCQKAAQAPQEQSRAQPEVQSAAQSAAAPANSAAASAEVNAAADPAVVHRDASGQAPTASGILSIDNKGYISMASVWKQPAVIPVCWESTAAKGVERDWVKQSVTAAWQGHSKLKFIGWGDCAPTASGVRITVRDVSANDGPHTIGLGTALNGQPDGMVLNFTFNTWSQPCKATAAEREMCIRAIAVHEFGHAIGFAHEQNRPDTPGECNQPAQGPNGDVMLTPWDPQSVMNYCNKVYNNHGVLSAGDIYSVQKIYGA
jgi:hypothetical protein